jgi:Tol biopolymer transport system component
VTMGDHRGRVSWLVRTRDFSCSRPCFFPDGNRVLFMRVPLGGPQGPAVSDNEGPWGLWSVDLLGGKPVPVFQEPGVAATRPDCCPVTGRIAFTGIREGRAELWLVDERGHDPRILDLGLPSDAQLFYPAWYPDGRRLVVTDYSTHRVLEVDVLLGTARPLTDPTRVMAGMAAPYTDPEGRDRLAFAGQVKGGGGFEPRHNRIWLQDHRGQLRQLDPWPGRMPAWSRSGDRLAFTAPRWRLDEASRLSRVLRPPSTIYVQRLGASGAGVGTPGAASAIWLQSAHAKWAPDGKALVAATSPRGGGAGGIALLRQ